MKQFSEYIEDIHHEFIEREDTEWANFWWDMANNDRKDRILLIGDSTARMVRRTLATVTKRPVDLLATSSGIHDELFINQLDCYFASKEYEYKDIFVQLGHHGELGPGGRQFETSDYDVYADDFKRLIGFLKQHSNSIIVESVFYTVVVQNRQLLNRLLRKKEKYDEEVNLRKKIKNEIMQRVADEMGIKWCDINGYMLKNGKMFRHSDHIHFENVKQIIYSK